MDGFDRFMRGRYGSDELSWTLLVLAAILLLVVAFFDVWWLALLPLVPSVLALLRMLSANITTRKNENELLLSLCGPVFSFVRLQGNKLRDRKTHVYFTCKHCKTVLRVPRGKGAVTVTCPRCRCTIELDT